MGIANSGLIFLLGLLMSQFTLTGYDASAHMTEETKDAAKSGPRGIILTVGVSFVVGWMYLLSLTFSIQVGCMRAWCRLVLPGAAWCFLVLPGAAWQRWLQAAAMGRCAVRSAHAQRQLCMPMLLINPAT